MAATQQKKSTERLELMVKAGLTPMQALVSATGGAARAMKLAGKIGTLQPGAWADVVVLGANPLDDIHNTQRIRAVIVGGKLMNRFALDRLLALGETMAKEN